jgi:hypothetical protein
VCPLSEARAAVFLSLATAPVPRAAASCGRIDGVFLWDAGDGRRPDDLAVGDSVRVPEPSTFGDHPADELADRKPFDVTVAVALAI